jgi:hypothetical protein
MIRFLQTLENGPSPSNDVPAIILRRKAGRGVGAYIAPALRAPRADTSMQRATGLIGVALKTLIGSFFEHFSIFQTLISWVSAKISNPLSILPGGGRGRIIDSRNPSRVGPAA